ncbi:MAG: putative DNA binding domain-containing protein [Proteobacteria bacterium]|nr:putative DNA binding domain-containing protein [Pseudomonadota bacterium]
MNASELLDIINAGETSRVQFKKELQSKQAGDIVAEMVAMSNSEGGTILFGVEDKTGDIGGLDFKEVEATNNYLFNWATNNIKPCVTVFTETVNIEKKNVLVVTVPRGIDRPYCDNKMVYWVKSAANKRRVSPEELKRLFQSAGKLYAEREHIADSSISDIDLNLFREFYENRYGEKLYDDELSRLMINLKLAKDDKLTLAGALMFSRNCEILLPDFFVASIWFWDNDFIADNYRSSLNITGNLAQQYQKSMDFILGALKRVQGSKSFSSTGTLEIPRIVFEEILVNALVHRDYFIHDSIKLFVFENRIEIKSPGKLPNNLTVEDIRHGIQRRSKNIVLTSFISDILPYRGVGSGILKSLRAYPMIDFENNTQAEYFKVTIYRPKETRQ